MSIHNDPAIIASILTFILAGIANVVAYWVHRQQKYKNASNERVGDLEERMSAMETHQNTLARVLLGKAYEDTNYEEQGMVDKLDRLNNNMERVEAMVQESAAERRKDHRQLVYALLESGAMERSELPKRIERYVENGDFKDD